VISTVSSAVAVTAVIAFFIYLLRVWIVRILFSSAFAEVSDLMPMQLLGDVLKMCTWLFGFVLVAKIRSAWFIAIELVVPLTFVLAAKLLIPTMGIHGVTTGYAVAYGIGCVLSIIAVRDILFGKQESVNEA
jgi:PST family polysaccharide transporter